LTTSPDNPAPLIAFIKPIQLINDSCVIEPANVDSGFIVIPVHVNNGNIDSGTGNGPTGGAHGGIPTLAQYAVLASAIVATLNVKADASIVGYVAT